MKKSKEAKAISEIAKHHDISGENVREEMQHAIDMAMGNIELAKMFGEGVRPSPEEFIRVISNAVKAKSMKN